MRCIAIQCSNHQCATFGVCIWRSIFRQQPSTTMMILNRNESSKLYAKSILIGISMANFSSTRKSHNFYVGKSSTLNTQRSTHDLGFSFLFNRIISFHYCSDIHTLHVTNHRNEITQPKDYCLKNTCCIVW